jgi:sodium/bile acid cotransporter 7
MARVIARNWFLICLCVSLGVTVSYPGLFAPWTASLEPRLTIGAALFLTAWTMPVRSLVGELRRPWPSAWAVAVSYGAVPALAWALGTIVPQTDLQVGLLLVASVPCTLASAVLWTRLAGGNEATALFTVLGTTLVSWLATTAWLTLATGTMVDLQVTPMMLDLTVSLVVPVALGQFARAWERSADFANRHRAVLGTVAQLFILAMVLRAGATVGTRYHDGTTSLGPALFAWSAALAVALHLAALYFGFYSGRWLGFDRGRQIAIAFSCSQKTLPVALLLFEQYFKADFPLAVVPLLFYHAGQLLLDTLIAHSLRREKETDHEIEEMIAEQGA